MDLEVAFVPYLLLQILADDVWITWRTGWILKSIGRSTLTEFIPIISFTENDPYILADTFSDTWNLEYEYVNKLLLIRIFEPIV